MTDVPPVSGFSVAWFVKNQAIKSIQQADQCLIQKFASCEAECHHTGAITITEKPSPHAVPYMLENYKIKQVTLTKEDAIAFAKWMCENTKELKNE